MTDSQPKVLQGIPASPGIGIGTSWILEEEKTIVRPEKIAEDEVNRHLLKFEKAIGILTGEYQRLKEVAEDEDVEEIIEAQIQTLHDPELRGSIENKISNEKYGVNYAIFSTFNEYVHLLEMANAQWANDRTIDIVTIRDQLMNATREKKTTHSVQEGDIVFANEIPPTVMVQLSEVKIGGIVMQKGGLTSHAIILSQSLGIPAVIGVPWKRMNLKKGIDVILDGGEGQLILRPCPEHVAEYQERKKEEEARFRKTLEWAAKPDQTACGSKFTLRANVEFLDELPHLPLYGAKGVGLLRTETILFQTAEFDVCEQVEFYTKVLEAAGSEPVTIRLFDAGGDKLLENFETEANPFLGWRGVRMLLDEEELLIKQLEAIYRASGKFPGRVKLLVPMISDLNEVIVVRRYCKEVQNKLKEQDIPFDRELPIGIMIEVPSAALMADSIAQYADFFSIGTNDLTQYTLAVDRGNEKISRLFKPSHPAVWQLIRMAKQAADKHHIPISVCGEMASDPNAAACLLGMGIHDLSMNAGSIPKVKSLLCSHSLKEMKNLAGKVQQAAGPGKVHELFEEFGR